MNSVAFKVQKKNGDYIKPTIVPAKAANERFGSVDGAIIAFFLICVSGLIYLLLAA